MIGFLPAPVQVALQALLALVCIFLLAPLLVVVTTSFTGEEYVSFPPPSWSLRWYVELVASDEFMGSLRVSLVVATISAVSASVLGTASAIAIVRGRIPARGAIQAILLSPLALPGLVIGIAILQMVAAAHVRTSLWTVVLGHILITIPYVIRLSLAALLNFDEAIERAAVNLGASRLTAFLQVTVPNVLPGLLGGALFAFIVSFEDVNVSLFLSSPDVVTLPVRIFNLLTQESSPIATAAGSVLTGIVLCLALLTDRLFGLQRAVGQTG